MAKKMSKRLKRGAICVIVPLSGYMYSWIGKPCRIKRAYSNKSCASGVAVSFEPIGWSTPSADYKCWDSGWFKVLLPALPAQGIAAAPRSAKARGVQRKARSRGTSDAPKHTKKKLIP